MNRSHFRECSGSPSALDTQGLFELRMIELRAVMEGTQYTLPGKKNAARKVQRKNNMLTARAQASNTEREGRKHNQSKSKQTRAQARNLQGNATTNENWKYCKLTARAQASCTQQNVSVCTAFLYVAFGAIKIGTTSQSTARYWQRFFRLGYPQLHPFAMAEELS